MKSTARIVLLMFTLSILLMFAMPFASFAGITDPNSNPNSSSSSSSSSSSGAGSAIMDPKDIGSSEQAVTVGIEGINKISGNLLRFLGMVGAMAAVVVLAIYGIQWITSSPQQKAQLKEKAWAYLIGAILAFGGMTIMGIVANVIIGAFGGSGATQ